MDIEGESTDAELITRYRAGDDSAASVLFARHHAPAVRFAARLAGPSSGEDLAAEAFSHVLAALRKGHGPDVAFRPYLMTTVRNAYTNASKRDSKLTWTDDFERVGSQAVAADESALRSESTLLAQAFATLPERWQTVLWHTTVEDDSTAEVGRMLGISPSAVAALAYRAREGLRQAYLSAHIASADNATCREVRDQLASYSRGQLGPRATPAVEQHLDTCRECTAVLMDLRRITSDLPALLAPALLGTAALAGRRGRRSRRKDRQQRGNSASGPRNLARPGRAGRSARFGGGGARTGRRFVARSSSMTGAAVAGLAVATVCALAVVTAVKWGGPDGSPASAHGLTSDEGLTLIPEPDRTVPPPPEKETPKPENSAPPYVQQPTPTRPPSHKPAKPEPSDGPPTGPTTTTFDLVVGLTNVVDLATSMSGDINVSSPGPSTLVIDITSPGGWNFSAPPPAGADCSAPSGVTPVQVTCVFAAPFTGTLGLLLLDTGPTKAFTATLTAPNNTDPTPGDATVSFSSP